MGIKDEKVTLNISGAAKRLHLSVARPFSVEIKTKGVTIIELQRVRGLSHGGFVQSNFETVRRVQAIPTGAIFARRVIDPAEPLDVEIEYRVRTGGDAIEAPEFD